MYDLSRERILVSCSFEETLTMVALAVWRCFSAAIFWHWLVVVQLHDFPQTRCGCHRGPEVHLTVAELVQSKHMPAEELQRQTPLWMRR